MDILYLELVPKVNKKRKEVQFLSLLQQQLKYWNLIKCSNDSRFTWWLGVVMDNFTYYEIISNRNLLPFPNILNITLFTSE